jgi:hypothetical protein
MYEVNDGRKGEINHRDSYISDNESFTEVGLEDAFH